MEDTNQKKNRLHYEELYSNYPVKNILYWVENLEEFLNRATKTEISWHGIYQEDFKKKLEGKKVLEMGCGDCTNAAIMAALGAEVYANDIAKASGEIIDHLNQQLNFNHPIKFIEGDFLKNKLPSRHFDFIVGKAFLHHLVVPVEKLFIKETARLLKSDGEARFFEPAVNSKIMDEVRWHIPIGARPSKFKRKAFKKWKENDPHPDRSFSSLHWSTAGNQFFNTVEIIPLGALERFSRLFPLGEKRNRYKRWAFRAESKLPEFFNRTFARSQLIIFRSPLERKKQIKTV